MQDNVKFAVVKALQQSLHGFGRSSGCWSTSCGLSLYQRFVNKIAALLGADCPPFTDPNNSMKTFIVPLSNYCDVSLIREALIELAPKPKCVVCGSTKLLPDPAGYYCDAYDAFGGELLCTEDHRIKT